MIRPTPTRILAQAAALALVLALAPGCDRNVPGTALAPTGIRPAPSVWPGSLSGVVQFDPLNAPDLATPPYPPLRIEVKRDTHVVASTVLSPTSLEYTVTDVPPGAFTVSLRTLGFYTVSTANVVVTDRVTYMPDLAFTINGSDFSAGMEVIGTMPGFRIADIQEGLFPIDVNGLSVSTLGVWDYPSLDYPDGQAIPAGTYRFKFATLFPLSVSNMTGWGSPSGATLTAPVTDAPAVLASGSASDIVMTFPTTGVYGFRLDERRQTFSVQYLHAAPQRLSRPARSARR